MRCFLKNKLRWWSVIILGCVTLLVLTRVYLLSPFVHDSSSLTLTDKEKFHIKVLEYVNNKNSNSMSQNNKKRINEIKIQNRCVELLHRKLLVSIKFQGGMGNVMFQFAYLYALSKTYNYTMAVPDVKELRKTFGINQNEKRLQISNSVISRCFSRIYFTRNSSAFNKEYFRPLSIDTYITGYMQSWKYFTGFEKDLRKLFTFTPAIITSARYNIKEALAKWSKPRLPVMVGIHIRRGDIILRSHNIAFGYRVADEKYLFDAIQYFRNKYSNVIFIVVSNDRTWSRQILGKEQDVVIARGSSPAVDMATLSLTNHTIMTVGTFGWWSAFLTNGEAVYFKWPFRHGSELSEHFDPKGTSFFYPHWKGI